MSKLRVESFTVSLDGFGAGPDQSLANPLRNRRRSAARLERPRRSVSAALFGKAEGSTGIDEDFAARGFRNIGAWILGRNMFGPIRGLWPDDSWKGWWGDNPPYHCQVFVLTHHPRAPIEMQGGTVFQFVTGGIHEALRLAREAAGEKDVRLGGGVATIQQFLREKLIDEMHLAVSWVLLGSGERVFDGVDLINLAYECAEHVGTPNATHVVIRKK